MDSHACEDGRGAWTIVPNFPLLYPLVGCQEWSLKRQNLFMRNFILYRMWLSKQIINSGLFYDVVLAPFQTSREFTLYLMMQWWRIFGETWIPALFYVAVYLLFQTPPGFMMHYTLHRLCLLRHFSSRQNNMFIGFCHSRQPPDWSGDRWIYVVFYAPVFVRVQATLKFL